MKRRVIYNFAHLICVIALFSGCGNQKTDNYNSHIPPGAQEEMGNISEALEELESFDDMFTQRDLEQVADVEEAIYVTLADNGTSVDGKGATVEGNTVTFTGEGVYVISGKLLDGQLVVDAGKEDKVQLVLQGVVVTNDTSAALYVKQADKVFVTTVTGYDNFFETTGEFQTIDDNNIDGAVFSKDDIILNGEGTLTVKSSYHGIVGKDDIKVTGGVLTVDAVRDGLQANDGICIADGRLNVVNSYEGVEAKDITVWGGDITITSSDDGINVAGGNDGSGLESFGKDNPFSADLDCNAVIYDGVVRITADGDGLDSNGNLIINGGEIYVNGPTNGGNGAIDYSGSGFITGGILMATGSSQMATNMSAGSTQCSLMVNFGNEMITGEIQVADEDGNVIMLHTPDKGFNNVVISHPDFEIGKTYIVSVGEDVVSVTFEETIYGQGVLSGGPGGHGGFGGGKGQGGQRPDMGEMPEGMEQPGGMEKPPQPPTNM